MAREYHGRFGWLQGSREGYCCTECCEEAEDVFELNDLGQCKQCEEDLVDSDAFADEVREQFIFGQTGR